MKIVCDACSAKYSISDDKVQGKVFKIRCKKCQNIIVVRGGAQAAEAAPAPAFEKETRVYDYGDGSAPAGDPGPEDQVWHVVVDQDQVGPLSVAEVQDKFMAGQIDAETYVWREGFADWLPLAQVDVFAGLAAGGTATGGSGAAAVSSMFGSTAMHDPGPRNDPADVFTSGPARAVPADDDDGDLFGRRGGGGPVVHSAQAPDAEAAKMRGQRNENSVLFSLNNLAQLASDSPKPAASASAMKAGGPAPGHAGGEGSGLIDIRSMATAYMGDRGGGAAKKPASMGVGSVDDLPVFSTASFSEPAVLMPMAGGRSSNNNKLLYGLIAGVAALAILAGVLIFVVLGNKDDKVAAKDDKKPETVAMGVGDKPAGDKPAGDKPTGDKPTGDKPAEGSAAPVAAGSAEPVKDTGTTPPPVTPDPATAKPDKPTTKPTTTSTKPDKPTTKPTTTTTKPDKPTTTKPDKPTTTVADSGSCEEVQCVLDGYARACCAKYKKGIKTSTDSIPEIWPGTSKPASGGGDLPASLDRDMISAGVAKVSGRAQSCGGQSSAKGRVKVWVKVGADGRVTSVTVKSTPDPALGSCVASAMQKATFGKTQSGGSFAYPFTF